MHLIEWLCCTIYNVFGIARYFLIFNKSVRYVIEVLLTRIYSITDHSILKVLVIRHLNKCKKYPNNDNILNVFKDV